MNEKKSMLLMDMGTSNTRLFLYDGCEVVDREKGSFGAGCTISRGRDHLFAEVKAMITRLLDRNRLTEADVSAIVASGMAGSELGICEVPHVAAPADIVALMKGLCRVTVEEITRVPFLVVPGVRKNDGAGQIADMMRGEEVETFGICDLCGIEGSAVLVLPGSHNKIVTLDEKGAICDLVTTMSGEMMSSLGQHTILRGSVSYDFSLNEGALREGAAFADAYGLGAALFHVRVLTKRESIDSNAVSSFYFGAVLASDAHLAREAARGCEVYIGGRENLRHAMAVLVGEKARELDDAVCADAVSHGLSLICKIMPTPCEWQ